MSIEKEGGFLKFPDKVPRFEISFVCTRFEWQFRHHPSQSDYVFSHVTSTQTIPPSLFYLKYHDLGSLH